MTNEKLQDLLDVNELRLTDDETVRMISLFQKMNGCEASLSDINTDNVDIMVHVQPLTNVLREDFRDQKFSRESLLEGAPEHTEDSWQVPILVK
ncbi:MAG: Asp-tRNA(Asn)/Glu-tRNA(Gln) amidotransferase subunit GatC [Clostridia bacterium]|nr:Asp-tRNA(Asn)/Glu-tRNA(Gln) amidotransferase subunit GatC [Clostridia bacterium]